MQLQSTFNSEVIYPESDGQPMADDTEQFRWIVVIKENTDLSGWLRSESGRLDVIEEMANWVSPRLGIRFDLRSEELQIYRPDGRRFLTFLELDDRAQQAEQRADQAERRADQAEQRAARLTEQLRSLGVDPDQS